ncbi:uncharacterized protein DS421_10g291810 [Arachis hypogaea]|nr:uncharacterized protein DS421_10g291810 [Arachis hypogaea]
MWHADVDGCTTCHNVISKQNTNQHTPSKEKKQKGKGEEGSAEKEGRKGRRKQGKGRREGAVIHRGRRRETVAAATPLPLRPVASAATVQLEPPLRHLSPSRGSPELRKRAARGVGGVAIGGARVVAVAVAVEVFPSSFLTTAEPPSTQI